MIPYDKVAKVYDYAFKSSTALAEDDIISSLTSCFLTHSLTIDLGCGTAFFLEKHPLQSSQYIGIDIAKHMLEIAKKKFPRHQFIRCDMASLPFRTESADNVVCLWAGISYAQLHAATEALRVLRKKGKVLLMFFNERYVKRKTYILNRYNIDAKRHYYRDFKYLLPQHLKVLGFNYHGDIFSILPKTLVKWILKIEQVTLGKLIPHLAFISIVYGEKGG